MKGNFFSSIVGSCDNDKDGLITVAEAKTVGKQLDISGRRMKKLHDNARRNSKRESVSEADVESLSDEVRCYILDNFKKFAFKKLFEALDLNKSGTLSYSETQQALKQFNIPPELPKAKEFFDSIDTDSDGQIDFKEYLQFIRSIKAITK